MNRLGFFFPLLLALQVSAQDSTWTIALDELVVTGQFEPRSLSQSVYQVRTIDSEMIQSRNATSIQSVLNTELGVRFSNDLVVGTSDISLMGMSGQNVKILVDGVPLVDRGAVRESLGQIDMNTVERIEIVEGPLSVVYGSDALAGVVNIITRKGMKNQKTLGVRGRIVEESAAGEYRPFTGKGTHNESVTVNWQGRQWYGDAAVTRNVFGGVQGSKEGRQREWLPKDQLLGMTTVGLAKGNVNVWYRLNYLSEKLMSPGLQNLNTDIAIDKEYKTTRFTHQLHADWDINGAWSFNAVASFQDYARRTVTTTYNVATGDRFLSPEPGTQDRSEFTSTTFRGTFLYRASDRVSLQPGVDINHIEGMGDRIDQRRSIGDYAAFVSAEIRPLSKLNIRPGVRFIHNSVYEAPPAVPSLNVKWSLSPKLDLRAAYARGFRAPALRELYFYFFDSSHSIIGNPDLKAEHSDSFTASLSIHRPLSNGLLMNTSVGAFYNRFDNMITLGVSPENPSFNSYINVADFKTAGGTVTHSVNYKSLRGSIGFALIGVYNEFAGLDHDLKEMMWTPEVNTTVSYDVKKTGTSLSAFYKFTGKRSIYEVVGDEYFMATRGSFHWIDLMASQCLTPHVDLSFGVRNLLNVTQLQNTSVVQGAAHNAGGPVPMSFGRSFVAGLKFRFNR